MLGFDFVSALAATRAGAGLGVRLGAGFAAGLSSARGAPRTVQIGCGESCRGLPPRTRSSAGFVTLTASPKRGTAADVLLRRDAAARASGIWRAAVSQRAGRAASAAASAP